MPSFKKHTSLLAKKSSVKRIIEHGISGFSEYALPFKKLSVGISEINGRYPQSGFEVDTQIEQVWYVESGEGTIQIEEITYEVQPGDMILIPAKSEYVIDGRNLKLVVSSSPVWFSSQHKHLLA